MEITFRIDTNEPESVALAHTLISKIRPVEAAPKLVEKVAKEPKTEISENKTISELTKEFPSEGADQGSSIALEDVRARVNYVIQAGKKSEIVQLLKKYGAARVTEIAANDYVEFLADLGSIA